MTTSSCCKQCLCDIKGSECNECHNQACKCHTQPLPTKDWESDRSKWDDPMVVYTDRIYREIGAQHHDVWDAIKKGIYAALIQRDAEIVEMFERIQEARKKAGTIDDYILLEEVIAKIKERNV